MTEARKTAGQLYGLADWWLWPFGLWREATDSWMEYCCTFLGGESSKAGGAMPAGFPTLAVDPWAVMRLWFPEADAVIEAGSGKAGQEKLLVTLSGPGVPGEGVASSVVDAKATAPEKPLRRAPARKAAVSPQRSPAAKSGATASAAEVKPAEAAAKPPARRPRSRAKPQEK